MIGLYQSLREKKSHGKFTKKNAFDPWDELLRSLKTEWELLSEKASAVIQTVQEEYSKRFTTDRHIQILFRKLRKTH